MDSYTIQYNSTNDDITSTLKINSLCIYDFGHVKGFYYKNDFTLYKILQKDFIENILQEHCILVDTIPLHVYSIETYPCIYENNVYKIPFYNITVLEKHLPLHRPVEQAQPVKQAEPLYQHQNRSNKNVSSTKTLPHLNVVRVKKQQEPLNQQSPLINSNAAPQQWQSLDQLMKSPSSLILQSLHPEHLPAARYFQPSMNPLPSLQLRQPQKQGVKTNQTSKTKHS